MGQTYFDTWLFLFRKYCFLGVKEKYQHTILCWFKASQDNHIYFKNFHDLYICCEFAMKEHKVIYNILFIIVKVWCVVFEVLTPPYMHIITCTLMLWYPVKHSLLYTPQDIGFFFLRYTVLSLSILSAFCQHLEALWHSNIVPEGIFELLNQFLLVRNFDNNLTP